MIFSFVLSVSFSRGVIAAAMDKEYQKAYLKSRTIL
jgi:hypothetical protein